MVAAGKVFHLSKVETLKKIIANKTRIEDQTAPAFLPSMCSIASDLLVAKQTPLAELDVTRFDQRKL